ncbi:MAG: hypothetical protein ACI4DW_03150 [Lachnospiraceae bacterium]
MCTTNPYEALTEDIILDKLNKSREHAAQGMYKDAAEVSRDMRKKYLYKAEAIKDARL